MPLQFKLLAYFLVFGMIIILVLWGFQSFFLQPFYTASKTNRVEQSAQIISRSINSNKNVQTTIENVARNNSMSVYVYDSTLRGTCELKYSRESDNPVMAIMNSMTQEGTKYGQASALSWLYMLATLTVIMIFILLTRRWLK